MDVTSKIKEVLAMAKKWVWVAIAGLLVAAAAWKKHMDDAMANQEQANKEAALAESAAKKLADEKAKLEAEQKAKEAALEEEKKKQLEAAKAAEAVKKQELTELSKKDKEKFKKEVADKLGVGEKKKGRPKK